MLPEAPLVLLRRDAEEAVSLSGKAAAQIRGIALPVDGGWTAQ